MSATLRPGALYRGTADGGAIREAALELGLARLVAALAAADAADLVAPADPDERRRFALEADANVMAAARRLADLWGEP